MVVENIPVPLTQWLPAAWTIWWQVMALIAGAALVLGYLVAAIRQGPITGAVSLTRSLLGACGDLLRMSPRRIAALAWLAVKESIHRLVIVAFAVFVVILLFAGWYLDASATNVIELYLTFVMSFTGYLVLLLALFLSVFSLPNDIAQKTLHTIVTKPVRAGEIVLGRILGFCLTGTALLVVTGLISYLFVLRGLNHEHRVVVADLEEVEVQAGSDNPIVRQGETSSAQGHKHPVFIYRDGRGRIETARGHYHALSPVESDRDGETEYQVGPPQLPARVPQYGLLRFRDRAGKAGAGINVGDEWTYRQYIEGGSQAAAIWRFSNLDPQAFRSGLRLELTIQVFRTHKGIIDRPVNGSIVLRNPDTGLATEDVYFGAREYYADTHFIPRKLLDRQGNPVDLWEDLVNNGQIDVEVNCLDSGQYFGMAQADLYLRANDAPFWQNFVKGYLGIWLQMVLVTTIGVLYSTFLNGAVAMLATGATILGGFFTKFILDLAAGRTYGGGPIESLIRLVTQANVMTELDPGLTRDVAKLGDQIFSYVLFAVGNVLPRFRVFSGVDYVAQGYDIPSETLSAQAITALAYVVPALVAAYFFFRSREVAQ